MSENEEREYVSVPLPAFDAQIGEAENLHSVTALAVGLTKNLRNVQLTFGIAGGKDPAQPPQTFAISLSAAAHLERLLKMAIRASLYGSHGTEPDQLF